MRCRFGFLLTTVAVAAAVVALAAFAALVVAAPGPSRLATATPRDGVRLIGDLRVGPLGSDEAVSTLAEVRAVWGHERTLRRTPACVASWGTGVRLLFTTFGGTTPCADQFLQWATVFGPRWKVRVGTRTYAIGDPRSVLPAHAKLIRGYGYQLATMPFPGVGGRTPTVMAHVDGRTGRIDRFSLFLGHAGD